MTTMGREWAFRAGSIAIVFAMILLWQAVTSLGMVSAIFLPPPLSVLASLADGFADGSLWPLIAGTVQRMLMGWALASIVGIFLGTLIGVSAAARAWLQPTLEFMRPLPASAVIPVAIALFGLSSPTVLAVVAFGSIWPVLLATITGLTSVEVRLKDVSTLLRLSRLQFAFKIGLPNAAPDIMTGLRLSLSVALIVSVVGEMLTSEDGLGLAILLAARAFRSADLFAGVVLLSAIGYLGNIALQTIERRVLRWRQPPPEPSSPVPPPRPGSRHRAW